LYNTPLELADHPVYAVRTAYQIRQALSDFHTQLEPPFRLNINFGIHTGMAVVGNVGAPQIMDFTAVGDTVNIAARLQGLSEGGQILISDATYERVQQYFVANPIGSMTLKGRKEPVQTYDVVKPFDAE
jgi:adenylate cyclase